MTIQIRNGSVDTSISRRGFVAGAASLTFAFTLGGIGRGKTARSLRSTTTAVAAIFGLIVYATR